MKLQALILVASFSFTYATAFPESHKVKRSKDPCRKKTNDEEIKERKNRRSSKCTDARGICIITQCIANCPIFTEEVDLPCPESEHAKKCCIPKCRNSKGQLGDYCRGNLCPCYAAFTECNNGECVCMVGTKPVIGEPKCEKDCGYPGGYCTVPGFCWCESSRTKCIGNTCVCFQKRWELIGRECKRKCQEGKRRHFCESGRCACNIDNAYCRNDGKHYARCECLPGYCKRGDYCDLCGGPRIPTVLPVRPGCSPLPDNVCTQQGHTHYQTFDGVEYRLQSRCKYLLAGNSEGNIQWSVMVDHENQDDHTRIKEITIQTPNGEVITYMNNNVKVDGNPKNDDTLEDGYTGNGYTLTMVGKSTNVRLIRYCDENGIVVDYDFQQLVIVSLHFIWENKVTGLCGNLNGNSNEETAMMNNLDQTHNDFVQGTGCNRRDNPGVCTGHQANAMDAQEECSIALSEKTCDYADSANESAKCTYENCLCNQCFCDLVQAYWSKCYFLTEDEQFLEKPGVC